LRGATQGSPERVSLRVGGKKCRLRRRGKQEKARREADLPAVRTLARAQALPARTPGGP
jgi:hypothetical protein